MKTIPSHFRNATRLSCALFVLAGLATASTIPTIDVTGVDWNLGMGGFNINQNGNILSVYFAGVINITLTAQDGQQYNRDTMCVDLYTDIYIGSTYDTDVMTPDQVVSRNLTEVAWLEDNALVPTQDAGTSSVLPPSDWATTPAQGTGLQVAIWDLTTPGGVQTATDSNQSDWQYWANYYEGLVSNRTVSDAAFVYQNWSGSTPAQMLEGPVFFDGGPSPTPEPATYALVGAALIGLCWRRRTQ